MLAHPTLEKLHTLRLTGMAKAFDEQLHMNDIDSLSTEERLGLMADRELTERDARRLKCRLSKAKLPSSRGLCRGYRLPPSPTPRPRPHDPARYFSVATRTPQRPHLRPHRNRQKLARVRLGQQSLS